uniref:Non-specific serine/threonine protein kinase n=1 Tax=Panagrellus redivivus TaxID=6233 RepID=A0A7E4ZZL3_PANRE
MASDLNPIISNVQPTRHASDIVHQGYLCKRYFKFFWKRYYILFSDGTLLSFKKLPADGDYSNSHKVINVKEAKFMTIEHPRPNMFLIEGHHINDTEQMFLAETKEQRDDWYNSLMATGLPESTNKITITDFHLLKMLGVGSFGKIVLGRDVTSKKLYAIKILKKKRIVRSKQVLHTLAESRVPFMYQHPFLIRMYYSFETRKHIFFVLDYCIGGDLHHHLYTMNDGAEDMGFELEWARFYAAEIACGLGYLHANNIIYRDLKLENVLLDREGHIKIADFGLSKEGVDNEHRTQSICGTPECLAPEVVDGLAYACAVDWWGFGIVVYEMIYGKPPFVGRESPELYDAIRFNDPKLPNGDKDTLDLLENLLEKDPAERLGSATGVEGVQAHPFFNTINWDALLRREVTPPIIPEVENEEDTKYFDSNVTRKPIKLPSRRHFPGLHAIFGNDAKLQRKFVEYVFHDKRIDDVGGVIEEHVEEGEPMEPS